jgi:hypothetical protein
MTDTTNKPINFATVSSLILSGLMSFLLCTSGLFSILSPLPLIHAALRWGKTRAYSVTVVAFLLSYFLLREKETGMTLVAMFGFYLAISAMASQMILTRVAPLRGLVLSGGLLISFLGLIAMSFFSSKEMTPVEYLTDKVVKNEKEFSTRAVLFYEKDSLEHKEFLRKIQKEPESLVKEVVPFIPKVLIILVFMTLWLNLCLGYKSRFLDLGRRMDLDKLIHIKLPDQLVWVAIAGLGLILLESYVGKSLSEVGSYIVTVLSVFYFFQGFGIYISLLDNVKVKGFFRTFLIVSTVYIAFQALIIIGFSDLFVNYRRFFKKNNTEGEL